MAENFTFELVSPERLLLSEKATEVVIPATEGEMTVLANHAPTMTTIKPGVVTVKTASGKTERYVVFGGFADILPTSCTILAESAVLASEMSRETLQKRIEAVRGELQGVDSHDQKFHLERHLAELTHLNGIVVPV